MGKHKLVSIDFPELLDGARRVHEGTGDHGVVIGADNFIIPQSVKPLKSLDEPLDFAFEGYGIVVLCLVIESKEAPNWYGCAFRSNLNRFEDVNIFFHPFPKLPAFPPEEYWTRTPKWSQLFRYVQSLGTQLYRESSSQVLVVPMFNQASYSTTGIFGPEWRDIVDQILQIASRHPQSAADASGAGLKRVVLSDFSRGRELMHTFARAAPGLKDYLREVWDFDGVGGSRPDNLLGARGVLYDQGRVNTPGVFHTPSNRWLKFNGIDRHDVHGNMPMLFRHAAYVTYVR